MINTLKDSFTIMKWAFMVLLLFLLVNVIVNLGKIQKINKENNVYHRTTACILSVPLMDRTDDYISNCYLRAEQVQDIKVDHFGNK